MQKEKLVWKLKVICFGGPEQMIMFVREIYLRVFTITFKVFLSCLQVSKIKKKKPCVALFWFKALCSFSIGIFLAGIIIFISQSTSNQTCNHLYLSISFIKYCKLLWSLLIRMFFLYVDVDYLEVRFGDFVIMTNCYFFVSIFQENVDVLSPWIS